MVTWKNKCIIYWFNTHYWDLVLKSNGKIQSSAFSSWCGTEALALFPEKTYATNEELNLPKFMDSFTSNIDKDSVIYYDKSTKYPRTKSALYGYKRCIKPEKADIVVLGHLPNVKVSSNNYIIFTNSKNKIIYSIPIEYLDRYFKGSIELIANLPEFKDTTLKIIHEGRIQFVWDPTGMIEKFNSGVYNKPFLMDTDLDKVINCNLPDPTLDDIIAIDEMIKSQDNNTIRLGSTIAAGFNVTKWPLTFRLLFERYHNWQNPFNGGNLSIVAQMSKSLQLSGGWSLWSVINTLDRVKETYSEEDIALAKEYARTLPEIKPFCETKDEYYLDTIPFIPDEYK